MKELTSRQQQLLDFIRHYTKTNGYPPSRKEMAEALECRVNSSNDILLILVRKGYLRLTPGVSRGVVLVEKDEATEQRDELLEALEQAEQYVKRASCGGDHEFRQYLRDVIGRAKSWGAKS